MLPVILARGPTNDAVVQGTASQLGGDGSLLPGSQATSCRPSATPSWTATEDLRIAAATESTNPKLTELRKERAGNEVCDLPQFFGE